MKTVTDHKYISTKCHSNGCQFLVATEAMEYALECLTRRDEIDIGYRTETVMKLKAALRIFRGGQ